MHQPPSIMQNRGYGGYGFSGGHGVQMTLGGGFGGHGYGHSGYGHGGHHHHPHGHGGKDGKDKKEDDHEELTCSFTEQQREQKVEELEDDVEELQEEVHELEHKYNALANKDVLLMQKDDALAATDESLQNQINMLMAMIKGGHGGYGHYGHGHHHGHGKRDSLLYNFFEVNEEVITVPDNTTITFAKPGVFCVSAGNSVDIMANVSMASNGKTNTSLIVLMITKDSEVVAKTEMDN